MAQYKDSNNKVHQIPEGFERLMAGWPVGYTAITDEEAAILTAPPPPSLAEAKTSRIKYINAEADKAFAQILAPYPAHEVSTWPNQYAEAWALQSDPAAYTPTLAGIALVSGETVAVLATAVLTKAAAYTNVSGQIVGKRKLKTAQIESCLTNAETEAITW